MTLAELVAAVRENLLEPAEGFWKDAELKRWLNDANNDLARAANLQTKTNLSLTANTQTVAVPADCARVTHIRINGSDIEPTTIDGTDTSTGKPIVYWIFSGNIYFWPIPDIDMVADVEYSRKAVKMAADTDSPSIPEEFHKLLILYAIGEAKIKADDTAFQIYRDDYSIGKADMQRKIGDIQADRFDVVLEVD